MGLKVLVIVVVVRAVKVIAITIILVAGVVVEVWDVASNFLGGLSWGGGGAEEEEQ